MPSTYSINVGLSTEAHRLSTIKNADKVIYLKDGKVLKVGSLKEVSQSIPRFTEEADLLDFK